MIAILSFAVIITFPSNANIYEDFIVDGTTLVEYAGPGGDVIIPDGIVHIGSNAFLSCNTITSVTIPESVTEIDTCVFFDCPSLVTVTFESDYIEYILISAFNLCPKLRYLKLPSVGDITANYVVSEYPFCVFDKGTTLIVTKDSYAHYWALENNQPFILEEPVILGDISGDYWADEHDAFLIIRLIASGNEITAAQMKHADVNDDGLANAVDALIVLKYIVGIDTGYLVDQAV